MKYLDNLTYNEINSILNYNPGTGIFRWKITKGRAFKGNVAGSINGVGYIIIGIDKVYYQAHRLAYLLMTGKWPKGKLDHKDGNRLNNKWDNIRLATDQQNCSNASLRKDNKSGYKGVSRNGSKWRARIRIRRKEIFLGNFSTPEMAAQTYNKAAIKYFGDYAKLNEVS